MKKAISTIFLIALTSFAGAVEPVMDALIRAYPEQIAGMDGGLLVMKSGDRIVYDDGTRKDFAQLIANPDIDDMFAIPYPVAGTKHSRPQFNFDPGRIRSDAFFKAVYGGSEKEVEANIETIIWLPNKSPTKIRVTKVNGVSKRLQAISAEIEKLPPEILVFATKPGGGFNWRPIAGTNQLSAHCFGIAIDINVDKSNYWRWGGVEKYVNQIPKEITDIFEAYGFIWGGRWYHYDTMHFEFRPELLAPTR